MSEVPWRPCARASYASCRFVECFVSQRLCFLSLSALEAMSAGVLCPLADLQMGAVEWPGFPGAPNGSPATGSPPQGKLALERVSVQDRAWACAGGKVKAKTPRFAQRCRNMPLGEFWWTMVSLPSRRIVGSPSWPARQLAHALHGRHAACQFPAHHLVGCAPAGCAALLWVMHNGHRTSLLGQRPEAPGGCAHLGRSFQAGAVLANANAVPSCRCSKWGLPLSHCGMRGARPAQGHLHTCGAPIGQPQPARPKPRHCRNQLRFSSERCFDQGEGCACCRCVAWGNIPPHLAGKSQAAREHLCTLWVWPE